MSHTHVMYYHFNQYFPPIHIEYHLTINHVQSSDQVVEEFRKDQLCFSYERVRIIFRTLNNSMTVRKKSLTTFTLL